MLGGGSRVEWRFGCLTQGKGEKVDFRRKKGSEGKKGEERKENIPYKFGKQGKMHYCR